MKLSIKSTSLGFVYIVLNSVLSAETVAMEEDISLLEIQDRQRAIAERTRAKQRIRPLEKGPADGALKNTGFNAELVTENSSSRVNLRYTLRGSIAAKPNGFRRERFFGYETFSITASAPIDNNDDDDLNNLASLDGLADTFNITFAYSRFNQGGIQSTALNPKEIKETAKAIKDRCIELISDRKATKEECEALPLDSVDRQDVIKYETEEIIGLYNRYSGIRHNALSTFYGFEGSVGYDEVSFLNGSVFDSQSNTFEETDDEKVPWSLSVFAGLVVPDSNLSIRVGGVYEDDFEESPTSTRCNSLADDNGILQCQTGRFANPQDDDSSRVFIEGAKLFSSNILGIDNLGARLRISYDFDGEDFWAFDAPVYLFSDKDSNLTGGVRFGYRTDNDDFNVGLFIGSTFELFN